MRGETIKDQYALAGPHHDERSYNARSLACTRTATRGRKRISEIKLRPPLPRIICRKASDKRARVLQSYYDEQLQLFTQKQLDAAKTLKVGEYPAIINSMPMAVLH